MLSHDEIVCVVMLLCGKFLENREEREREKKKGDIFFSNHSNLISNLFIFFLLFCRFSLMCP